MVLLVVEPQGQQAETPRVGVVAAGEGQRDRAVEHVGERGQLAVAVLDADLRHPDADDRQEARAEEVGRREALGEQRQDGQLVRVIHLRQIEVALDVLAGGEELEAAAQLCVELLGGRERLDLDPELRERLDPHVDGGLEVVLHPVADHDQRVDPGPVEQRAGVVQHVIEGGDRRVPLRDQVLELPLLQVQVIGQLVVLAPGLLPQVLEAGEDVAQRRDVGGRHLGAPGRGEVQLGHPLALDDLGDEVAAPVQVVDHLEHVLGVLLRGQVLEQQPAEPQVQRGALRLGREDIGGLLHPVVQEAEPGVRIPLVLHPLVLVPDRHEEALLQRRPQRRGCLLDRVLVDQRQDAQVELVADAGGQGQDRLGVGGQLAQASDHQVDHVLGDPHRVDLVEIEHPAPLVQVELEEAFLVDGVQEHLGEERVSLGLVVDPLGEQAGAARIAQQRVGHQLVDVLECQRFERDRLDRPLLADVVQGLGEQVLGVDLVVAVGADEQQVTDVRIGDDQLEQAERGRIGPLQVVEEDDQRVLFLAEHVAEVAEHLVEAVLVLDRP